MNYKLQQIMAMRNRARSNDEQEGMASLLAKLRAKREIKTVVAQSVQVLNDEPADKTRQAKAEATTGDRGEGGRLEAKPVVPQNVGTQAGVSTLCGRTILSITPP